MCYDTIELELRIVYVYRYENTLQVCDVYCTVSESEAKGDVLGVAVGQVADGRREPQKVGVIAEERVEAHALHFLQMRRSCSSACRRRLVAAARRLARASRPLPRGRVRIATCTAQRKPTQLVRTGRATKPKP